MSRQRLRAATLAITTGLATALALLGTAGPAAAHAEATIDNPTAGAADVTLTVTAEAESSSAGITSVRIALPPGINPGQVSLANAPSGWTLTANDDGYTVGGPALQVGADARHVVRIAELPATAGVLLFKTLVTYTDGQVDRWIEAPSASNPEPAQPAPTVSLRPGPAATAATPTAPATPTPTGAAPETGATSAGPVAGSVAGSADGGGSGWIVPVLLGIVAAVAAAVAVAVVRRRRSTS